MVRHVKLASRYLSGAETCLVQALATYIQLKYLFPGISLRIGVSRDTAGRFQAHAWVEHQGRVIIGESPEIARFVPMPILNLP